MSSYITRALESEFMDLNGFFKAVLVTGARQVGKTTMLRHLAEENRTYVTLDDGQARAFANTDPKMFFETYRPPILIDEVQKAPALFDEIKLRCDSTEETGLFWLTGSAHFRLMTNVRESLAGRIGILKMYGLSQSELNNVPLLDTQNFSLESWQARAQNAPALNADQIWNHIWCGGLPMALETEDRRRTRYYNTYIETYLLRDVAQLGGITDEVRFHKFLTACAAVTGQQVNYSTLAQAAEISQPTAKEWMRMLEGLGVVHLLQPFSNNQLKRLTKTPKMYFCDTGLCAYLAGWPTQETLRLGAANGAYFETYVIMEFVKTLAYSDPRAHLSYYRDSHGKEIDLVLESGRELHPFEIKLGVMPDRREVRKFSVLDKTHVQRGYGGIVCMCDRVGAIDESNAYIPSWLL